MKNLIALVGCGASVAQAKSISIDLEHNKFSNSVSNDGKLRAHPSYYTQDLTIWGNYAAYTGKVFMGHQNRDVSTFVFDTSMTLLSTTSTICGTKCDTNYYWPYLPPTTSTDRYTQGSYLMTGFMIGDDISFSEEYVEG